jgi:hypothetical protein
LYSKITSLEWRLEDVGYKVAIVYYEPFLLKNLIYKKKTIANIAVCSLC